MSGIWLPLKTSLITPNTPYIEAIDFLIRLISTLPYTIASSGGSGHNIDRCTRKDWLFHSSLTFVSRWDHHSNIYFCHLFRNTSRIECYSMLNYEAKPMLCCKLHRYIGLVWVLFSNSWVALWAWLHGYLCHSKMEPPGPILLVELTLLVRWVPEGPILLV